MVLDQDGHTDHTQNAAKKPASRCLLSDASEASSGDGLENSKVFDHYVMSRKSGLLQEMPIAHTGKVSGLAARDDKHLLTLSPSALRLWRTGLETCPDGHAPDEKRRTCEPCKMGTARAGGKCNECPPGRYQGREGRVTGVACPADTYSREPGQAGCYKCPRWTLLGTSGPRRCTWCPPGSMPDANRSTCDSFQVGIEWQPGGARQKAAPSNLIWYGIVGLSTVGLSFVN